MSKPAFNTPDGKKLKVKMQGCLVKDDPWRVKKQGNVGTQSTGVHSTKTLRLNNNQHK